MSVVSAIADATLLFIYCCFSITYLLADDFYKDVLPSSAIELAIEDLFPGAKVKLAIGNSNNTLTAKELTLDVGISVVLTCTVVEVLGSRGVRDHFLKEGLEVLVKAALCNNQKTNKQIKINRKRERKFG